MVDDRTNASEADKTIDSLRKAVRDIARARPGTLPALLAKIDGQIQQLAADVLSTVQCSHAAAKMALKHHEDDLNAREKIVVAREAAITARNNTLLADRKVLEAQENFMTQKLGRSEARLERLQSIETLCEELKRELAAREEQIKAADARFNDSTQLVISLEDKLVQKEAELAELQQKVRIAQKAGVEQKPRHNQLTAQVDPLHKDTEQLSEEPPQSPVQASEESDEWLTWGSQRNHTRGSR